MGCNYVLPRVSKKQSAELAVSSKNGKAHMETNLPSSRREPRPPSERAMDSLSSELRFTPRSASSMCQKSIQSLEHELCNWLAVGRILDTRSQSLQHPAAVNISPLPTNLLDRVGTPFKSKTREFCAANRLHDPKMKFL